MDPNPGYGKIPLQDIPQMIWGIFKLLTYLLTFGIRISFSKRPRSWKEDMRRAMFRISLDNLPISAFRRPVPIERYAKSKRYSEIFPNLNERIERPEFSGNWICKPNFERDSSPREADIVILYLHGGGYVMFEPSAFSTLLMRIAESVSGTGKSVAVFILDYSLAPEFKFPIQISQTSACWEYLINELQIPPSKISLMGDSAGGSLCLSFLAHLAHPLPSVKQPKLREKPGKLCMMSPWVSLLNDSTYRPQRECDLLGVAALRHWANLLIGDAKETDIQTYLEFSLEVSDRPSLKEILPAKTLVTAGEDELFLVNISRFVNAARNAGADVSFEAKDGQPHNWQFGEAFANDKAFLELPFCSVETGLLSGADAIGKWVSSAE